MTSIFVTPIGALASATPQSQLLLAQYTPQSLPVDSEIAISDEEQSDSHDADEHQDTDEDADEDELEDDDSAGDSPSEVDAESTRRPLIYRTREERREAGLKHEVFPWLTVSGLLEAEWINERLKPIDNRVSSRDQEIGLAVQIGAEITPTEWSKVELIYEYEDDDEQNKHTLDEAVLSLEYEPFEWEMGRIYLPFGEYFSHFVEGPVLEFAETRARGMNISWARDERLDLTVFAYQGKANSESASSDEIDWGFAIEAAPGDVGTFGLSYISDLADAMDSVIDQDELPYSNRVDGISAYAVFGLGALEFNLEVVAALDDFQDLQGDRNRPLAWNAEVAFYPSEKFEWALRVEGTKEIEDAPRYRVGVAGAWWIGQHSALRVEYLYGSFAAGLAEDELEQELDSVHLVAAQINVEF